MTDTYVKLIKDRLKSTKQVKVEEEINNVNELPACLQCVLVGTRCSGGVDREASRQMTHVQLVPGVLIYEQAGLDGQAT